MTTRRTLFRIAGGVLAGSATAALTGCRDDPPRVATAVPDVVLADSRQGLMVLGGVRPRGFGAATAVSADGSLICAVTSDETGRSTLEAPGPTCW